MQRIHEDFNAHFMISVWPKFHAGTNNYDALNGLGFIYPRNAQDNIVDFEGYPMAYYDAFRKQIPAGLGFSISGIPYWTMDIGGFAVPERFQGGDTEERYELNTRWFQYGTFTPLLRVHGQAPVREMWTMGGDGHEAFETHVKFDRLRYRLLPYIYSLVGVVTQDAGSIMRPLVMDFRSDPTVRNIDDQYMFGPALLVNPVTTYQARSRRVILPDSPGGWYDFWTGVAVAGGQTSMQ